jgi:hypothetical protein
MTAVRITKLARIDDFFVANVSNNGTTVRVDNSCGSWTATANPKADPGTRHQPRKDVHPMIAKALQQRLRSLLRGEKSDESDVDVDPVSRDQSKYADERGELRYSADDSRVFPGANGVRTDATRIADRVARAGAEAVKR